MRRLFVSLCAILALALAACHPTTKKADQPNSYPALWQVDGPDGQVEGWLFGTIHALPDDVDWQSQKLKSAIARADMLVVEVANLGDGAALSRLFEDMAYDHPNGPIRDRISPALRPEFDKLLVEAKVRRSYFDPMESWAAALALAQVAQEGKPENGVDRVLLDEFKGREIVELEGARDQLSIFDRLPEKDQRALLNAVLSEAQVHGDKPDDMAASWRSGNLARLEKVTQRGILANKDLKQILLIDRNTEWTTKLENLFSSSEKPLVAVGAGHMIGPDGLPAMLEKDGYTVKRIQ